MSLSNAFALLDDENEDPQLLAKSAPAAKPAAKAIDAKPDAKPGP